MAGNLAIYSELASVMDAVLGDDEEEKNGAADLAATP
jgi:hypothetical protein